jgi:hypothetical protein
MKIIFTAIAVTLILLFSNIFISAQTGSLVTQVKVIDTDTTFRFFYFYDNNNNKVLETKYFLQNDNQWKRLSQTEWIYNDNKCVIQREKIFRNTDWVNNHEINFTYEDGLLISERHSKYVNGMLVDYKLITISYDNNLIVNRKEFYFVDNKWLLKGITENTYQNNLPETTVIKKIGQNISENLDLKLTSEYNSENLLTKQTFTEKSIDNIWINKSKTDWYYHPDKKISSQRSKVWNSQLSTWENSSMIEFTYNVDGKIASETFFFWKTMFWERVLKYIYEYSSDGKLIRKVMQMPIYRQWRDFSSIDYSNFNGSKPNQMETKLTFWGNKGTLLSTNIPFIFNDETEIRKGNQIIISYEKIDNTDISTLAQKNEFSIAVYPNPSEDEFYFNPEEYNSKSWLVYDMNGKIVKQSSMSEKTGVIDLSNFTEGIYLLRVITPKNVLTQKLIRK